MKHSTFKKHFKKNKKKKFCHLFKGKKIRFKSRRKAFQEKKRRGIKLYIYQCSKCNDWHLTRSSSKDYAEVKELYQDRLRRTKRRGNERN